MKNIVLALSLLATSMASSLVLAGQPKIISSSVGADGKTTIVFDAGKDGVVAFDGVLKGSWASDAPVSKIENGVKSFTLKDPLCSYQGEANLYHCQGKDVNDNEQLVFDNRGNVDGKAFFKVMMSVVQPFINDAHSPAMFGTERHIVFGASQMTFSKNQQGHVIVSLTDGFDPKTAYPGKK